MRKALVAAMFVLTGCTSNRAPAPFVAPDASLDAPAERVWQALTMVYTDLNIPIENMDRASWFLRSDVMRHDFGRANGEIFDCGDAGFAFAGGYPLAQTATVTASVTTLLVPDGERTTVRNRVNASTTEGDDCQSRGVLEDMIIDALHDRLP